MQEEAPKASKLTYAEYRGEEFAEPCEASFPFLLRSGGVRVFCGRRGGELTLGHRQKFRAREFREPLSETSLRHSIQPSQRPVTLDEFFRVGRATVCRGLSSG